MNNLRFNPQKGQFDFAIEERDIKQAREVAEMVRTSEGWQILKKFLEVGREDLIQQGKNSIKNKDKEFSSGYWWAVLDGFDAVLLTVEQLIERANQKQAEEILNGHGDDGSID